MSLEQKVQISLIVTLTGLVIVFAMLIFLTFIIKGYGAAVRKIVQKMQGTSAVQVTPAAKTFVSTKKPTSTIASAIQGDIPEEVVAAISAAVYTMYGTSATTIKSIRRAVRTNRSEWGMAGLLENTRPF